jgi:hypothetical protein
MFNNEYFSLTKIKGNELTCESERADDEGNPIVHTLVIPMDTFQELFLVNYCTTTHKTQGETIIEEVTIWDWKIMNKKLKYTAMSRVKLPSQINFRNIDWKKEVLNPKNLDSKIDSYRVSDEGKGLETNINEEHIIALLEEQECLCYHCHQDMKINEYGKNDENQYSVDRLDNNLGHVKNNVVISCWGCNRGHRNKYL